MRCTIRWESPYLWIDGRVPAPPAAAWRTLIDTRCWPLWGPSVREVDCAQPRIALGAGGRVRTALGFWLPFEVTAFDPDRLTWWWRVGGIAATGHRVAKTAHGGAQVGFGVPLWAAPYLVVCAIALERIERLLQHDHRPQ